MLCCPHTVLQPSVARPMQFSMDNLLSSRNLNKALAIVSESPATIFIIPAKVLMIRESFLLYYLMTMQSCFLVVTSVLSSTIREYGPLPISYRRSSCTTGPITELISAVHFIRCKLIPFLEISSTTLPK